MERKRIELLKLHEEPDAIRVANAFDCERYLCRRISCPCQDIGSVLECLICVEPQLGKVTKVIVGIDAWRSTDKYDSCDYTTYEYDFQSFCRQFELLKNKCKPYYLNELKSRNNCVGATMHQKRRSI